MAASTLLVSSDHGPPEVAEHAAGLAHDHRQRGDVQDVHVRLDHQVQAAPRQQVVVAEIAVAADAVAVADQPASASQRASPVSVRDVAGRDSDACDSLRGRRPRAPADRRSQAPPPTLAHMVSPKIGATDTPSTSSSPCISAIWVEKNGVCRDETLGAIERVDQPGPRLSRSPSQAELLAEEPAPAAAHAAMTRADGLLGLAIGRGHRACVALELHCHAVVASNAG